MTRALVLLIAGAALGSLGTYYATLDRSAPLLELQVDSGSATSTDSQATQTRTLEELIAREVSVAGRAAVYELAARSDQRALESLVRRVVALPESDRRRVVLEALLSRYAEIDPHAAARAAETAAIETAALAQIYRTWARTDPDAALDAASRLRIESQYAAFAQIAAVWAKTDAHQALRAVDRLGEPGREMFRSAVLREWAKIDPEAMLDYVADLGPGAQQQALFASAFQERDPQRVLELAERLPPQLARMARQGALQRIAMEDPLVAIDYVERLPRGPERQQLIVTIATSYARTDPDAALAWARNLRPAPPGVVAAVLGGVAQTAPERALDLALELGGTERMQALQSIVANGIRMNSQSAAAIADRVLSAATPANREQLLQMMTSMWSATNPEDALRWLLASSDRVPQSAYLQVAQQFGRSDPAAAAAYTSQIPAERREAWIGAVAQGYAMFDPDGAMSWIAQYRGQPGYEGAVGAVAQHMAQYDAPAAARLLDTIDASAPQSRDASLNVAFQWAMQDPRAAADWVIDLGNPEVRTQAAGAVAQQWSQNDAQAARGWALSLPAGATRDAALSPVLAAVVADTGGVDQALLDAFSSDLQRQNALQRTVLVLAQSDPAGARRLIAEHVTNPTIRAQMEQMLETMQNRPQMGISNVVLGQRGVPFLPPSAVPYGPAGFRQPLIVESDR